MMTKSIGSAMATAVQRANENPEYLRQRIADLEAEVKRLRAIVRESKVQHIDISPSQTNSQMYAGRPVITPSQAAQQTRISKSTVSRYLESGHWDGVQLPGTNRWLVFVDRGLPVKVRGKKKIKR